MFLLFTINEGVSADEAAVAQQVLFDIRNRVFTASIRQQQMKTPVLLSNVMHGMVRRHVMSQQTLTAEESVTLRHGEGIFVSMDCEAEDTTSQHAVLQPPGTVRWYYNTAW